MVKAEEKELTESEKAVKMKLYGNLTREVIQWHPARLLCIRFNVKPPFGDDSVVGSVPSGGSSKFDLFGRLNVIGQKPKQNIEQKKNEDGTSADKKTENKIVLENDKPLEADEVVEKPPIGKKHALKKYDQFTLNTSCFWHSGPESFKKS